MTQFDTDFSTDLVIPHLYIGPWDSRTQVSDLKIKYVVSLLSNAERRYSNYPAYLPDNVQEYSYLAKDQIGFDLKLILDDCLPKIHKAVQAKENVLIHCAAGISRSASIIIAYLIQYRKMDMVDAFRLLKNARPSIQPNPSFLKQIQQYGK